MDRRDSLKVIGGSAAAALGGFGAYRTFLGESDRPGGADASPGARAGGQEVAGGDRDGWLLLGVSPSERDLVVLQPFERWLGKRHAVVGTFVDVGASEAHVDYVVNGLLETTWRRGHVPHVFWQPYLPSRRDVTQEVPREVADGEHDETLRTWAEELAAWAVRDDEPDRRVYLNFAPEMNGDWAPWSPAVGDVTEADFVDMWRHVHDLVHDAGLEEDHVQWIWTLDTTTRDVDRQAVYPGDEYVDWAGVHGYNWANWGAWQDPEETYGSTIEAARSIADKPIAITELGCSPETRGDGPAPERKDQWIADAYDYFREEDVRMTLWFNVAKETDWSVFDAEPGADTTVVDGEEYEVYPAYRAAVADQGVLPSNRGHDRRLTDEEFRGEL